MIKLLYIASLIICVNSYAAGDAVTHSFSAGGSIVATEMNANFQDLANRNDATQTQVTQNATAISNLQSNEVAVLQYLGNTPTTLDGGQGIRGMNELCQVSFSGSRMCTTEEYANTITYPAAELGVAWIRPVIVGLDGTVGMDAISGHAGYDGELTCSGWESSSSTKMGMSVSANGAMEPNDCDSASAVKVSCCGVAP